MYPLHRRIIRQAFKTFGLSRWSHWEEGWPHLGLVKAEEGRPGAVLWRGREVARLLPAAAFAEAVGEEVVILGSGPSLRNQDLRSIRPEAVVLLNGALRLAPSLGGALACAISDERFAWGQRETIRAHLARARFWLLAPGVLRVILARDPDLLEGGPQVILMDNLLRPWRARRQRSYQFSGAHLVRDGVAVLSIDPDRGLASCGTVAFEAIQFALYARPQRIGLGGVDIAEAVRFYEEARPEPSFLEAKRDRILAHFALAAQEARRRGIMVECYSPVSALLACLPYSDRLQPETTRVPTGTLS